MNHFEKYHNPQFSVKEYFLPFLAQYVILLACIKFHRLFVGKGAYIGAEVMVGDEMSSPTTGRLAYCLMVFAVVLLLTVTASKMAKKGREYMPFFLGLISGTFLWQSVGEELWNFSVNGGSETDHRK